MHNGAIYKEGTPEEIFHSISDIKRLGLDVTVVVELAERLKIEGFNLPDVLTISELVDCLC